MRYKNNNRPGIHVIYKASECEGFVCVDLEATPEEYIYSVDYEVLTTGFNYMHYTTRCSRPAFVVKDGLRNILNVNNMGGWHLTPYDTLPVDRMGRLGAVDA